MAVFIVLLRAIGPATHKIMSMAKWREAVAQAGFSRPETYVATGNMIVDAAGGLAEVTDNMNEIVLRLGLADSNRAIVRTPEHLQAIYDANPLPEAASLRPSQMGVYFFAAEHPDLGWTRNYEGLENLRVVGQHLVVD